ncbi:facilitated trehalose transporter Tret1-like isoform X1 [Cotesia glomerata]|uniref:Major facilitator superfamily (MFS) profile domain-containing protein n=2 Tax=Cotesia glomerata TaxID=32391 RepID=A0AAV7HZV5_COTGL|nr:facilitated trehalose transporter Tret1-like isoform X1 [Cotesia glomerata]KAH0539234.1 hypothetical protein KQX54_002748 [Cotesia glomerata]
MSGKGRYTSPEGSKFGEYWAAFVCSVQAFCVGCILGWTSPTLVILLKPDSPIPIDHGDASTIASSSTIGHLIAALISKQMIERVGRKNSMFLGGLPLIICWSLTCFAHNVSLLIVARLLAGVALGVVFGVTPLYLGEIASVEIRGIIGSTMGVMINLGILFAFIVIPYLSIAMAAVVFLVISLGVEIAIYFIPESPYFLVAKSRESEAEMVLEKLRGKLDVSEELMLIKSLINETGAEQKDLGLIESLNLLFRVKSNLRSFSIINLLVVSLYLGGLVSIVVYGNIIFQAAGNSISDHIAIILIAITQVIASIISSFIIDHTGRKPLIFGAGAALGICNFVIGGYFFLIEYTGRNEVMQYSFVPLVAAIVLVFASNIGVTNIQSILTGEILASNVKGIASGLSNIFSSLVALVTIKMYQVLATSLGHSIPFLGFSVIVTSVTIILMIITPETKGRTFAEIQQLLVKRK